MKPPKLIIQAFVQDPHTGRMERILHSAGQYPETINHERLKGKWASEIQITASLCNQGDVKELLSLISEIKPSLLGGLSADEAMVEEFQERNRQVIQEAYRHQQMFGFVEWLVKYYQLRSGRWVSIEDAKRGDFKPCSREYLWNQFLKLPDEE